jgi:hypothetical protein
VSIIQAALKAFVIKQDPLSLFEQYNSRSTTQAKTGLSASRVIPKFDIFSQDSNSNNCDNEAPINESFVEEYCLQREDSHVTSDSEADVNYLASEDFRSPYSFLNAVK